MDDYLTRKVTLAVRGTRHMDPDLYRAAQTGNWEAIQRFPPDLYKQLTPNGNTLLHVLAQSGDHSAEAVKNVLAKEPYQAVTRNTNRETPLVIASRRGYANVVEALIGAKTTDWFRQHTRASFLVEIIRPPAMDAEEGTQDKKTALLEAVRYNRLNVVKIFAEKSVDSFRHFEFPSWFPKRNTDGTLFLVDVFVNGSPLYLAVEKGHIDIVAFMLSSGLESIAYRGPRGRTALHAAVARDSPECTTMILNKFPHLMKKVDVHGWTALHYAAKFNRNETVNVLLSKDNSVGYVSASKDGALTALHIAVINGHLHVAKEILSHCPDCWEMVTYKNKNILHLAIENEQQEVLEFILDTSWASELINKKDEDGNTALHHYVGTKNLMGFNLVNHPWVDRSAFNKKGLTPLDIVTRQTEQLTTRQFCSWIHHPGWLRLLKRECWHGDSWKESIVRGICRLRLNSNVDVNLCCADTN
ncbi:OLC1v1017211C2 [Oldenlandia corymbosa var. corymbosa]|uniref:OLC1v1017211C2 n=1 Tax=Oldenlandia corymbosa var. corymbosa TaxID=529605 RepID=A0AAV1E8Y2_OLDCO|nr:OLC1v1017211C2 [Oldenlandia corymbosa var. corymbosa]